MAPTEEKQDGLDVSASLRGLKMLLAYKRGLSALIDHWRQPDCRDNAYSALKLASLANELAVIDQRIESLGISLLEAMRAVNIEVSPVSGNIRFYLRLDTGIWWLG